MLYTLGQADSHGKLIYQTAHADSPKFLYLLRIYIHRRGVGKHEILCTDQSRIKTDTWRPQPTPFLRSVRRSVSPALSSDRNVTSSGFAERHPYNQTVPKVSLVDEKPLRVAERMIVNENISSCQPYRFCSSFVTIVLIDFSRSQRSPMAMKLACGILKKTEDHLKFSAAGVVTCCQSAVSCAMSINKHSIGCCHSMDCGPALRSQTIRSV